MKRNSLDKAVSTILSQYDEDRCWSLYLASVSNPFTEEMTFDDFLKKTRTPVSKVQKEVEQGLNEKQMEVQLEKATKLLSGFIPPSERGG